MNPLIKLTLALLLGFVLGFGSAYINNLGCQKTVRIALEIPKSSINNNFKKVKDSGVDVISRLNDTTQLKVKKKFRLFRRRVNK